MSRLKSTAVSGRCVTAAIVIVASAWNGLAAQAAPNPRSLRDCWSRAYTKDHIAKTKGQEVRTISAGFEKSGPAGNVVLQFTRVHALGKWDSFGMCEAEASGLKCTLDGDARTARFKRRGDVLLLETGGYISMEQEREGGDGFTFFHLRGPANSRFILYKDESDRTC